MLLCRLYFGPPVETIVEEVQFLGQLALDVEPPVANEHCLRELGAIRTQECGLAAIYVAVMPTWKYTKFELNSAEIYNGLGRRIHRIRV